MVETALGPDVYIEELPYLGKGYSVKEARTSALFFGAVEKGDIDGDGNTNITTVRSLSEFEDIYGGPAKAKFAVDITVPLDEDDVGQGPSYKIELSEPYRQHLYSSVKLFFENGGALCTIFPTGNYESSPFYGNLDIYKWMTDFDAHLGSASSSYDLIVPCNSIGIDGDPEANIHYKNYISQILVKSSQISAFAIVDVLPTMSDAEFAGEEDGIFNTTGRNWGAAYQPMLSADMPYPFDDEDIAVSLFGAELDGLADVNNMHQANIRKLIRDIPQTVPASGAIAGAIARNDWKKGIWSTPANISLHGIKEPDMRYTGEERGAMYEGPEGNGIAINTVRYFPNRGSIIWGARTLEFDNADGLGHIASKRFFLYLEQALQSICDSVISLPNTAMVRITLKARLEAFLNSLWRKGALAGKVLDEAYRVDVIADNPPADIVRTDVSVALARPGEFIVLKFGATG